MYIKYTDDPEINDVSNRIAYLMDTLFDRSKLDPEREKRLDKELKDWKRHVRDNNIDLPIEIKMRF